MANETQAYDYEKMKQESYRQLLNSEIQATAAKEQALKYTQNALQQQGLANQGMSESARVGIYGNYANANANAMNTYRQELLQHSNNELANKQSQQSSNYDALSDLIDGTFTTDVNGNTNGFNLDLYKRVLTNPYINASFNGDELDLSNANLSDADKATILEQYKGLLDYYKKNGSGNVNNDIKIDNEKTFTTSANDTIYFKNNSGHNNNFNLTDSNGKTTEWEMGGLIKNYKNHIDVSQAETDALTHSNGDIWLNNKGDYYSLVIKDQNGNVRAFEGTSSSKKDFDSILELFNKYGNMNLTIAKKNTGSDRTCYMKDDKNNWYIAQYDGDGYIYLEKSSYLAGFSGGRK